MPVYIVDNEEYDIPKSRVAEFEGKAPNAKVRYTVGEDVYDIPIAAKSAFEDKYKDAQPFSYVDKYLNDAYAEREKLEKMSHERRKQLQSPMSGFVGGMAPISLGAMSENSDEELKKIYAASNANDKRIEQLEAVRDGKTNNFFRAFGNTITSPSVLTMGISDINDASAKMSLAKDIENGEVSDTDKELAYNLVQQQNTAARYEDDMGWVYRAGEITAHSIPFMVQIGASGGFTGLTKLGAEGAKKGLIRKATGMIADDLIASATLANTLGAGGTVSNILDRKVGRIQQRGDDYSFVGGKDWAEAIYKGEVSSILEYYTEKLGGHLEGVGGKVIKGLDNIGLKKVSKALAAVGNSKVVKAFDKLGESVGYNGYLGEVMEEEANIVLNSFFVGDNKYSDLVDGRTQTDIWGGLLFSSGFMELTPRAIAGGLKGATYLKLNHDVNKSDRNAASLIGKDWDELRTKLEEASNDDIIDVLGAEVIINENLTMEQKAAASQYVGDLLKLRGFNTASMTAESNEVGDAASDAFQEGYNTADAKAAKTRLDEATARVREMYESEEGANEFLTRVRENPAASVELVMEEGGQERAQIVLDYINALWAYDGMMQRVADNADMATAQSDAEVDKIAHKDGYIQSGVYDGRKVYVKGGNLDMAVVVDAETGEVMTVATEKVTDLTEQVPAKQEKEQRAAKIREQFAANLNAQTSNYSVNEEITLNVNGEAVPAMVTAITADGIEVHTDVPVNGANNNVFTAEQLDGMVAKPVAEAPVAENKMQQAGVELPDVPDYFRLDGVQYNVINRNDDGSIDAMADGKRVTLPAGQDYSKILPTDKKGKVLFIELPVTTTVEYFTTRVGDAQARAELIDNNRKAAEKELAKYDKRPNAGTDPDAYASILNEWKASKEVAQAKVDYWAEVARVNEEIQRSDTREAMSEDISVDMEQTPEEFVAGVLGGIKITPESFKRETGLSNSEQRSLVGYIADKSKGGVSVERAAEIILENFGEELRGLGFSGDMQDMRDMIIDILSNGNPRSFARRGKELRMQAQKEERLQQLESIAAALNFDSAEEMALWEETVIPGIIVQYQGFDENEYYTTLANENNNNDYDTTRAGQAIGNGSEILQGEQPVDNGGNEPVGERNQGGEVQHNVQGNGENVAPQADEQVADQSEDNLEMVKPVGISEQLPLQNGNNELTLQQENEQNNVNEINIPRGGQILESVPQGEHGENAPQIGGMEETAARLGERIEADGGTPQGGLSRNVREIENRVTREYAQENGLWIPFEDVFKLGRPSKSGNEHDTYVDTENRVIYKVNNRMNTPSIVDLLNRMALHNKYFPNSKYSLVGFTAISENGDVWPVFAQDYVPGARVATNEEIDAYMGALGFAPVGEGRYSNGEIVAKDLRPRNVLVDADGDVYVVDAEFEPASAENAVGGSEMPNSQSRDISSQVESLAAENPYDVPKSEEEKETLRQRANKWAKKVGVKVHIIESYDDVTNRRARKAVLAERVSGWFSGGEVYIYMPHVENELDLDKTYIHEVVGHKGLKTLLGKDFDALCDAVWAMMSDAARAKYLDYIGAVDENGNLVENPSVEQMREAADEYMAAIAEDVNLDKGVLQRIIDWFRSWFNHNFADDAKGILNKETLTDEDIIDLVRLSYANLTDKAKAALSNKPAAATSLGIVNAETLQLTMNDGEFAELVKGENVEAMSAYLKEIDDALRVDDASPLAGEMVLREEYRKAVEQYGGKENIPVEVMRSLNERMKPYSELARGLFDRKYALQDRIRELEIAAEKATAVKEKEAKAENKNTAFGGFLADKTVLGANTAQKALNKKYKFDGKVMTVAEFVEDAVGRGDVKLSTFEEPKYKGASRAAWNRMDAKQQEADAKNVKESGTKTIYTVNDHDLGKTAYEYAKFLQQRAESKEQGGSGTMFSKKGENKKSPNSAAPGKPVNTTAKLDELFAKIDKLKQTYNSRISKKTRGFITDIARELNLTKDGPSHYRTFPTALGDVTLRVSNHNSSLKEFELRNENEGVSIIISAKKNKKIDRTDSTGKSHVDEFFYPKQSLERSQGRPLVQILESIEEFITTGVYVDKTGIAQPEDSNGFRFKKDDATLIGTHSLTEEKLRKAIKMGGLANPSTAIFEMGEEMPGDYGEITFVMPSSMVDKKTGRNTGAFAGDAWTPTYPQVERQMGKRGAARAYEDVRSVPKEMQKEVKMGIDSWLDGRDGAGMAYLFLQEEGLAPELSRVAQKYSDEVRDRVSEIAQGEPFYRLSPEHKQKIVDLYIAQYYNGDRAYYEGYLKEKIDNLQAKIAVGNVPSLIKKRVLEDIAAINEYGYNYEAVSDFLNKVQRDINHSGGVNDMATTQEAARIIRENGLEKEFQKWKEDLIDRYEIKEVIFKGFTPTGNRKYVPHTLENVSKDMKEQGRNGAVGLNATFNKFAAGLLKPLGSLDAIRKHKGNLKTTHAETEAFRDKWSEVYYNLAEKLQPNAKGYEDYGLDRVAEAAKKKDPKAFIKSEYGIELSEADEKALKDMVWAIQNEYPVMYFETKFERPVYLDEFAGVAVPENVGEDIVEALNNAGVKIETYEPGNEKARMDAVKRLSEDDDIRFRKDSERRKELELQEGKIKMSEKQRAKAEEVLKALEEAGHKDLHISSSITDWGVSTYIQGDYGTLLRDMKLRISDHSTTSVARMGEYNYSYDTPVSDIVEYVNKVRAVKEAQQILLDNELAKEKERIAMLEEKWERIKHFFDGLRFYKTPRSYKHFDEFASDKSKSNILQTDLGDGAFAYEYSAPQNGYGEKRPSFDYIDAFNEEQAEVETTRLRKNGNGKKETAPETASVQEEHQPTVVSSADGAKVLKDLDSAIKEYENKSGYPKTLLGDIAKLLNAKKHGSNSQYATFEAMNGRVFTIRLANHNATVSTFDNHNEDEGISIVVTAQENDGITNDGKAHVVEFFYDAIKLRKADGKPLVEILKSIKQALYSGEYKDNTGLANVQEVNSSTAQEDGTRFRKPTARDIYDEKVNRIVKANKNKVKTAANMAYEAYVDSMESLKVLQDAIAEERGRAIQSNEDAYTEENHLSSKNKIEMEAFQRDYGKPLQVAIAKLGEKGASLKDVTDYLIAKHGLERNIVFSKRDAEKDGGTWDGTIKDYSGLTELTGKQANFTAAAEKMVADFEKKYSTNELWKAVNAATKWTWQKEYEAGMLTKEQYELDKRFQYYVPLRGWNVQEASDVYEYSTSSARILPPANKKAYGRKSVADSPVAHIFYMAQSAVVRGNKNLMKQKVLNLAENSNSPLLKVHRMWYERTANGWAPVFPQIPQGATAQEINDITAAFEADMKAKKDADLARQDKTGLEIGMPITKPEAMEHVVRVMRAGREYVIYVNGNPRAAMAVNGKTNPEGEKNKYIQAISGVNRWMAQAFTSLNPAFTVVNLSRDVLWGWTSVVVKEDWEYAKKYRAVITELLMKAQMPQLLKKWENGTLDRNIPIERDFEDFLRNGGETGFTQLLGVEDYKKNTERFLKEAAGEKTALIKKGLRAVGDGIEFANRSIEDTVRFAVFRASRMSGRDMMRSIHDAKEITVNFNKKGSGGMGAAEMNTLYLFFNAAVQSTANFGRMMKKHPKKTIAALGVYGMAGFLAPTLAALSAALFGDDDDEYWDLPEWTRRNNICLRTPWFWVTIPLPHELRPFYGLGELAASWMYGKEELGDAIKKAALGFTDMLPLDFTGSGGDLVINLAPTALQPVFQLKENVDYFGVPIYKDTPYNESAPEWKRVYKGTSQWLVDGTKWLSDARGGHLAKGGVIDFNPAMIEFVFESYTGGLGKTLNRMAKTTEMLWNEDIREMRNVPVFSSFLYTGGERTKNSRMKRVYHDLVEEFKGYNYINTELRKEYRNNPIEAAKLYSEFAASPEYKKWQIIKAYKKHIDKIEKAIRERTDLPPEKLQFLEDRALELKTKLYEAVEEIENK